MTKPVDGPQRSTPTAAAATAANKAPQQGTPKATAAATTAADKAPQQGTPKAAAAATTAADKAPQQGTPKAAAATAADKAPQRGTPKAAAAATTAADKAPQQGTPKREFPQGAKDRYIPVHRRLVKTGRGASDDVVGAAQMISMAAPAPSCPNTGSVSGTPFAAGDSSGICAGYARGYGDKNLTCLVYGSDNWLSTHAEYTWRAEGRNEHRLAGFIGTDGLSYGQLNSSHAFYHTGTGIGGRWGGSLFMAPSKTTEDITHTLPAKNLPPPGTRLLSTTHVRWRFNWSGMLSAAALSFLRIFFRRERKRPIEVVWKHLESDRKAVEEQTCANKNWLAALFTPLWRGFSRPSEPHLRDCLDKLKDGESVSYTSSQQRLMTMGAGLFASAGRQTNSLDCGNIQVARSGEQVLVTMTRATDKAKSLFGVLPGGVMAGSGQNKPGVETWTYAFAADDKQGEEKKAFQKLIHSVFNADSGLVRPERFGQEGQAHLLYHARTSESAQSHGEAGVHVLQPQWLAKRWLPNHAVLGLSKQTSKVAYTTETVAPGSDVKHAVRTTERRNRAIRGSEGVRQEILTTRFIRPNQANLAGTHLLLRVKHKYSHATPQTVDRDVMKPLKCLLGAEVGTLAAPNTPTMPSPHAINVAMDLRVEHLVALSRHRARHIKEMPDERLRKDLQQCIDGWPKAVENNPLPAFQSLRDLMERTADRSTEDATLLLGCLNHLIGKLGPRYALQLRHKAGLYSEPEQLAQQLLGKYAGQPMKGLQGVRARFYEVRKALERIDYARHQLQADSTQAQDRQHYEDAFDASQQALRGLLHLKSRAEREQLAEILPPARLRNAGDAYIFAVLCAAKPARLAADPLRRAKELERGWDTYADTKLRKARCDELLADMEQQSNQMGEPGFPYGAQKTQRLRQTLSEHAANLRTLKNQTPAA